MTANTQVLLASRPEGEVVPENFRLVSSPLRPLAEGEIRVRNHYLSLDPYMRGRMSASRSYAQPQPLDEVMIGGTVGEVVESRSDRFQAGDRVVGVGGWQAYATVPEAEVAQWRKIEDDRIPLSAHLGAVGMPGVTAWYGLTQIIAPRPGETVVVSSASGAVGSAAGQLAKARGCRVVGIAGGPDKCRHVVEDLGFDACIDYKAHPDLRSLAKALKQACPDGIDGYFENVGGMLLDAVLLRANPFARIALCGMIAGYDGQPIPLLNPTLLLISRIRLEGFVISEHMALWPEAQKELGDLLVAGRLRYCETLADGLAAAPEAFIGLLKGRGVGKQLVRLG